MNFDSETSNHSSEEERKRLIIFQYALFFFSIEFLVALVINLDAKSEISRALFLGYSAPKLAIIVSLIISILSCLYFSIGTNTTKIWSNVNKFFENYKFYVISISLFLFLLPINTFGSFETLFPVLNPDLLFRVRPLVTVYFIIPIQISIIWIQLPRKKIKKIFDYILILTLMLILFVFGFIYTTKIGITPDKAYWNVVGIPITMFQLVATILIASIVFILFLKLTKMKRIKQTNWLDLLLMASLFLVAAFTWIKSPMLKHYFSIEPNAPEFQPYPFSDARLYDIGAISVIDGQGIFFDKYMDKPLYVSFLSLMHIISDSNYDILIKLQIIVFALSIPLFYLFAKKFSNRWVGLVIALIIILKQRNAIVLSYRVASVNPRLIMTEIPTMIAILVVLYLIHSWMIDEERTLFFPFFSGIWVGVSSLLRLNPTTLAFALPMFMLIVLWKNKKLWFNQSLVFFAGFALMISPWLLIGQNENRVPYFFEKFINVFNARYINLSVIEEGDDQVNTEVINTIYSVKFSKHDLTSLTKEKTRDYEAFPFFVFNHTLHNILASIYSLPDSFEFVDQDINTLSKREYWQDNLISSWTGEISNKQIPFILMNILFISIGIRASIRKWGAIGLGPLYLFFIYCFTLGLSRNSGSRYIVPVEWIIYLYYAIGLSQFFKIASPTKGNVDNLNVPVFQTRQPFNISRIKKYLLISISCFLFILIPYSEFGYSNSTHICEQEQKYINYSKTTKHEFVFGQVLYPVISDDSTTFVLFACGEAYSYRVHDAIEIRSGDFIIVNNDNFTQSDASLSYHSSRPSLVIDIEDINIVKRNIPEK